MVVDSVPPDDVLLRQEIEVRDEQVPVKNSRTALKLKEPVTLIVCVLAVAINLYQTSSFALPVQPANDWVALASVPDVGEQATPIGDGVKLIAFAHKSLTGAAKIILNRKRKTIVIQ